MQEFPHALPVVQILQQYFFIFDLAAASTWVVGVKTVKKEPPKRSAPRMIAAGKRKDFTCRIMNFSNPLSTALDCPFPYQC